MIIDGHAHVCKDDYGNIDALLAQYEKENIDKGVIVPGGMIDVRKMTKYISGEENSTSIVPPNHIVEEAINKYPERFYGLYCVNPHLGDSGIRSFENAIKEKGFSGLKLAPLVHQFSLTSEVVLQLADLCGELGVPFYSHVVFSPAATTKKFAYLAKEFPKTTFILGHMGFGPADIDAIEFGKKLDNVYFETSDSSFLIIKEALNILGSERIIFGTEFPMYHTSSAIQNIYALGCKSDQMENILYRNILRILSKLS
jgi:predicted TIM-barrel fold metal-dependent hydrolase